MTPRLNDRLEGRLNGSEEDSTWIKLKHRDGEIDFIVGALADVLQDDLLRAYATIVVRR